MDDLDQLKTQIQQMKGLIEAMEQEVHRLEGKQSYGRAYGGTWARDVPSAYQPYGRTVGRPHTDSSSVVASNRVQSAILAQTQMPRQSEFASYARTRLQ